MQQNKETVSLLRRLMAMLYDVLLLLGVLFAVSAVAVALNKGEAVDHPAYYVTLAIITFIFFGWFWTHGGQTLGMRTWKFKIIGDNEAPVTWKHSLIRFLAAVIALLPAGIGLFWMLIDRERLAWHDKLSSTRLIRTKSS